MNHPNFGPYASKENISAFLTISERAFAIYHEKIPQEAFAKFSATQHLFVRQLYLAETTSFSIRLLTSWAMLLQALTLTRTRLEHVIVCSFLIHEKQSLGLEPFIKHISINDFRHAQAVISDSQLAKHLRLDMNALKTKALEAQKFFKQGFEIDHDKFERKWTKLDLRSMAKRRDEIVAQQPAPLNLALEQDYLSLYMTASSIVHSDASALSHAFMDIFSAEPNGPAALMPVPSWAPIIMAFTSHYDLIQVREVVKYLGYSCESEITELHKEWLESTKKYLS